MFIGNVGHEHSLMYFLFIIINVSWLQLGCLVVVVVGGPTDIFFCLMVDSAF